MVELQDSRENRNQPRVSVKLRVDVKVLPETAKESILAGDGYRDLEQETLSMSNPRQGHKRSHTFDVSPTGLRLASPEISNLDHGTSVELDLHIPGERRVVKLLAEVMWANQGPDSPIVGLRFAALEDEGLRRLREYLTGLWRA